MGEQNQFELLFNAPLDVDERSIQRMRRSGESIIGDEQIGLLRHENRIALAKGRTVLIVPRDAEDDDVYYDIRLKCVVQSHPECRFHWSRLKVDFTPTAGALIRDMVPREVRGESPVEIEAKVGVGLTFELLPKVLKADASAEYGRKRTVYYPEIVSSGIDFRMGFWDFLALGGEYLHTDRELRLLLRAPAEAPVYARFDLRAKVKLEGWGGLVPLLARTGKITEMYRLD